MTFRAESEGTATGEHTLVGERWAALGPPAHVRQAMLQLVRSTHPGGNDDHFREKLRRSRVLSARNSAAEPSTIAQKNQLASLAVLRTLSMAAVSVASSTRRSQWLSFAHQRFRID
jgi:hypothetical protein